MTQYHFWVGNKTGYVFSTKKECPIKKPIERLKYLGYTDSVGWPKRMSTGRLLHKPSGESFKKQKKLRNQIKN